MPIVYCDKDGLVMSVQGHKTTTVEHQPTGLPMNGEPIILGVPVVAPEGESFSVGVSQEDAIAIDSDPGRWQFNGTQMVLLGSSGEPSPVNTKRSNLFAIKVAEKRKASAAKVAAESDVRAMFKNG